VAQFDFSAVPPNAYRIVVTQGATSAGLPFQILGGGQGARFRAELITPSGISFNTPQTLYVEFANVGNLPMVAPLLAVRADSPGFGFAEFSLDAHSISRDFWAASRPSISSKVVSFFATGRIPGVLLQASQSACRYTSSGGHRRTSFQPGAEGRSLAGAWFQAPLYLAD